jgi:hypothetical protein
MDFENGGGVEMGPFYESHAPGTISKILRAVTLPLSISDIQRVTGEQIL